MLAAAYGALLAAAYQLSGGSLAAPLAAPELPPQVIVPRGPPPATATGEG